MVFTLDCCNNGAFTPDCNLDPPCGTLLSYPYYDPQSSSTPGFVAGVYVDNSEIYAGTGDFSVCYGQDPAPARIMTSGGIQGPGAYSTCFGTDENYNVEDSKYLYNHPNLQWEQTYGKAVYEVKGAIPVADFFIGRINITFNNITFQQIGKIKKPGVFGYFQPGAKVQIETDGAFEVLKCFTCDNGAKGNERVLLKSTH